MSLESPSCPGTCCEGLAEEAYSELGRDRIAHSRRLGLGHCREGPASAPGVGGGGRCTLEASRPPAIFNDLEV